jgi:hypothetical protein
VAHHCSKRILQHPFHPISHKSHRRPFELILHSPPLTPAPLLAGYVLLHQEDVCCMPRMHHTKGKSSKLVYNFSTEAPFRVLHVDAYSAGAHSGFEGSTSYLIGCCGMFSFGILEPVTSAYAFSFAYAIMKMQLRFEFCHTVVLDKDSKFFSICREYLDLIKTNCHVLSGDNHNPVLVKWLCRYVNKGLRIVTNRRNSIRVALEALLLLLNAWNSCPVPGTDISHSLVAVGHKFASVID